MKMKTDLMRDNIFMSNSSKSSSMSSSVRGGGGGGGRCDAVDEHGNIGGARRSATSSLAELKERVFGASRWRLSPGQEEEGEGAGGEVNEGGDMLAPSGTPLTQSRCVHGARFQDDRKFINNPKL